MPKGWNPGQMRRMDNAHRMMASGTMPSVNKMRQIRADSVRRLIDDVRGQILECRHPVRAQQLQYELERQQAHLANILRGN